MADLQHQQADLQSQLKALLQRDNQNSSQPPSQDFLVRTTPMKGPDRKPWKTQSAVRQSMMDFTCENTKDHLLNHLLEHTPLPDSTCKHLQDCPNCLQQFQDFRELIQALDFTHSQFPPASLKEKVLERIHLSPEPSEGQNSP
ncbi:hypothetical protein ACFPRG_19055 [Deinococcus cellulosilyticus]